MHFIKPFLITILLIEFTIIIIIIIIIGIAGYLS